MQPKIPMPKLSEEGKRYKKALCILTEKTARMILLFDKKMKEPQSEARGKDLAALIGHLEFENDSAMHFGLKYSFPKIKKIKTGKQQKPV